MWTTWGPVTPPYFAAPFEAVYQTPILDSTFLSNLAMVFDPSLPLAPTYVVKAY